jgi:ERCC4-type nuclease
MLIKVDYRENDLFTKLQESKSDVITITSENLAIGDIIIYDEKTEKELLIIERKTLKDLAASIRDGRYNEQSFRLNQCELHNHNIIYLIEGDINKYVPYKTNVDKNALISSMVSISYFKGFSLYRTMNLAETAEWLLQLTHKIQKTDKPSYYTGGSENQPTEYTDVVKRVKKDNITPDNISTIMLSQIPGVSVNVASVVIKKFGNIKNLISSIETNTNALSDILIETKSGAKRKISKTCVTNMYNFLINGKEQIISVNTDEKL